MSTLTLEAALAGVQASIKSAAGPGTQTSSAPASSHRAESRVNLAALENQNRNHESLLIDFEVGVDFTADPAKLKKALSLQARIEGQLKLQSKFSPAALKHQKRHERSKLVNLGRDYTEDDFKREDKHLDEEAETNRVALENWIENLCDQASDVCVSILKDYEPCLASAVDDIEEGLRSLYRSFGSEHDPNRDPLLMAYRNELSIVRGWINNDGWSGKTLPKDAIGKWIKGI